MLGTVASISPASARRRCSSTDPRKIDVSSDREQFEVMMQRTGRRTVPQVFIDDRHVGGYSELRALLGLVCLGIWVVLLRCTPFPPPRLLRWCLGRGCPRSLNPFRSQEVGDAFNLFLRRAGERHLTRDGEHAQQSRSDGPGSTGYRWRSRARRRASTQDRPPTSRVPPPAIAAR